MLCQQSCKDPYAGSRPNCWVHFNLWKEWSVEWSSSFKFVFLSSTSSLFQIIVTVIFFYDIIFTQNNFGLIPFAYTFRLENESQVTEVTLTSSKYLSFYCFDFEHTAHNNFVLIIMFYTCYHLLSCITLNDTPNRGNYFCKTQKTINNWKISGMLIVEWPIRIKFRTWANLKSTN